MNQALTPEQKKQAIIDLMTGFSVETTPGAAQKIPDYRHHLRPGTVVYVTFLPGSDFQDTIKIAKRLREEGFEPAPHFAARSIPNKNILEENIKCLRDEAGVDHVLAIAGAVDNPIGEFSDSTQLLDTGLFDKYGIKKIGIAGHPEGSPDMSDEAIRNALKWKNSFANRSDAKLYIVTQFAFEAKPIIAWDKKIQADGNKLPIHIGVPGLATIKSLINHAKACGVGPSMKFLTKQALNVTKLLTVSAPDKLVSNLAEYKLLDENCGITAVHMYPLGGLKKTSRWSYGVIDGELLFSHKNGFEVTVDID